jgi:hypothetical protein
MPVYIKPIKGNLYVYEQTSYRVKGRRTPKTKSKYLGPLKKLGRLIQANTLSDEERGIAKLVARYEDEFNAKVRAERAAAKAPQSPTPAPQTPSSLTPASPAAPSPTPDQPSEQSQTDVSSSAPSSEPDPL